MDLEDKLSDLRSSLEDFRASWKEYLNDIRNTFSNESVKRPAVAVLLIGIMVLIGVLVFSDSPNGLTSETHVVEFTDRGFDPIVIEIDRGDTVRFVNNASISMWIASDPYPTNIDYSNTTRNEHCVNGSSKDAFDQCSTGEVYEFTFDKSGAWGYHNQKPFASGGEIRVD